MGILVGLLLGIGLFLIWWSCWTSPPRSGSAAGPNGGRPGGPRGRIAELLIQAGVESVTPRALLTASVGVGLTMLLLSLAVSQSPSIAVFFAVFAGCAPMMFVRAQARRRRAVLRELWPDVVDNLTSGVRAGLSLPEALGQLAERGPATLRPAFAAFSRDYRATGRFGDSLDGLKDRLADPAADRICEALRITREVGGSDLGRLLRNLSAFLREDARTRAELEARQSWTVNGARLAVAAPWIILAILATQPQSVRAYNSAVGFTVLLVGAAVSIVAYRLMVWLGRLPDEERVLT